MICINPAREIRYTYNYKYCTYGTGNKGAVKKKTNEGHQIENIHVAEMIDIHNLHVSYPSNENDSLNPY